MPLSSEKPVLLLGINLAANPEASNLNLVVPVSWMRLPKDQTESMVEKAEGLR